MNKAKFLTAYCCPNTHESLQLNSAGTGLTSASGVVYRLLDDPREEMIPDFLTAIEKNRANSFNLDIYNKAFSAERYRNELNWLFATFGIEEDDFRRQISEKLYVKKGDRILVTACGLGNDIAGIARSVGPDGMVFAQDLAAEMVLSARNLNQDCLEDTANIHYSISDASLLPFPDNYFDGVFHFGGINLFDDIGKATREMARVVRSGGRVVFGDESVAPWLRNTDYGRMAMNNNSLWEAPVPLDLLPVNISDFSLNWVLGNCFYLISFSVEEGFPYMNPDVPHIGPRGGSMRTRYFGQLEGVTEKSKAYVAAAAKQEGISIHDWLEKLIVREQSGK